MTANKEILPEPVLDDIVKATGATSIQVGHTLQELWSGYGSIVQLELGGLSSVATAANISAAAHTATAILKLIEPPQQAQHPRGWNTSVSHQRKIRSYEVETHWYQHYVKQCDATCKVPSVIATGSSPARQWILMEDLSAAYPRRAGGLSVEQAAVCLRWLAAFHAQFLQCKPTGLWDVGTYWHLETRGDELQSMPDGQLKTAASELNERLNNCEFQSIVHGDAKVANFCFSENMDAVAAVDFQYIGGGVGIKDVVYFLGSCLDESTIEQHESDLLSVYFKALNEAVSKRFDQELAASVERAWSALYAIAWTDFYRFLEGWMPGHKKINRYTKQLAHRAFEQLFD